jgi:hypothetical protein
MHVLEQNMLALDFTILRQIMIVIAMWNFVCCQSVDLGIGSEVSK